MCRPGTPAQRPAFTLIELLVVIAILGVVTGLVLAGVQRAREAAQRTECLNHLKNLGLAVRNYESGHGHLPPGAVWGPFPRLGVPDGAGHGLWAFVLPHLDQTAVAQRYRFDLSYDDPGNQPAVTAGIPALVCPGLDPGRVEQWPDPSRFGAVADYAPLDVNPFLADIGLIDPVEKFAGPLPANAMVRLAEITDGIANTILLAQACGRPGVAWSSPLVPVGLKEVFPGAGGPHGDGTPVCMVDGSVHFLSSSVGIRMLARLATRAGGEVVNVGDF
jgi:prepilin-type N-terminal cleavage/methylation domain-containing protein